MTASEFADSVEAGRAWNAAVRSRPGNPDQEKPRPTWSRPTWDAQEQADREAEREAARETAREGPDPRVEAFMKRCEEKHRAYWEAHPWPTRERSLFD